MILTEGRSHHQPPSVLCLYPCPCWHQLSPVGSPTAAHTGPPLEHSTHILHEGKRRVPGGVGSREYPQNCVCFGGESLFSSSFRSKGYSLRTVAILQSRVFPGPLLSTGCSAYMTGGTEMRGWKERRLRLEHPFV